MPEKINLAEKHDEGYGHMVSEAREDEEIYYPCVYLRSKDLPKLKVGQKVMLEGVVKSVTETEDDDKMRRNCEVEVSEMTVSKEKEKNPRTAEDMDEISKGLDELEDDKD